MQILPDRILNSATNSYDYKLRKSYIIGDDVLAQTAGSIESSNPASTQLRTDYLLYDGHGSTRQLIGTVDNSRTAEFSNLRISIYDFDAYGIELPQTATSQAKPQANSEETNLRYSGEYFDKDLKQQYLRARYYNQNNGQFNRLDPYSGDLVNPQSLHKYAYCAANPVNLIDPSGNFFSLEETTMTTIIIGELQKMATAAIFGGIFGAYNGYKNYLKDDNPDKSFWEHVGGGFIDGAMSGMAFYLLFGALAEFPLVAMWATGIINSAFITAIIYDDSLSIYEKVAFISATIWASFLYAEAMGTKLLNKSMQNYRGPTSSGRSSSSGNTTSFEEGLSTGGKPTTPKSSSNSARSGVNENNSATRNSGAPKRGLTNPELIQKSGAKAFKRITGKGHVAGIKRHSYATKLLKRYQRRFGDKGLRFGESKSMFGKKSILDARDINTKTIYDWKFGNSARMSKAQRLKYQSHYPDHAIEAIKYLYK